MARRGRSASCPTAPQGHRGRPTDARGADATRGAAAGSPRARQQAWDAYAERWWVPDEAVDDAGVHAGRLLRPAGAADRGDRLGIGESTVALAAARPDHDVAGLRGLATRVSPTPWAGSARPGSPTCGCSASTRSGRWSTSSRPGELPALWTFFPDPWHKKRHHKRRLVTPGVRRAGREPARPGRRVAAGDRLGRLRRADGRGAGRRARPRRRRRRRAGPSGR